MVSSLAALGSSSSFEASSQRSTARSNAGGTSGASAQQAPSAAAELQELKNRDRAVRAHEAAHLGSAGGLANGGASYTYTRGSDGQLYATGGEVSIDLSPGRMPEETATRARQIERAALAPADPSAQDYRVAAQARAMAAEAELEIARGDTDASRTDDKQASSTEAGTAANPQTEPKDGSTRSSSAASLYELVSRIAESNAGPGGSLLAVA